MSDCRFCPPRWPNGWAVVLDTEHWKVAENPRPAPGARHHFVLVPHVHVTEILALTPEVHHDLWSAFREIRNRYGLVAFCFGARSGEGDHIHVHMVRGDENSEEKFSYPLTGPEYTEDGTEDG